jgi:hypothetical protein
MDERFTRLLCSLQFGQLAGTIYSNSRPKDLDLVSVHGWRIGERKDQYGSR